MNAGLFEGHVIDLVASSVESVGQLRLGKFAKYMISGDFGNVEGAKSVRFSHGHFDSVVQALYGSAGELLFGAEIVEDQFSMIAQRSCDLFHRFDA